MNAEYRVIIIHDQVIKSCRGLLQQSKQGLVSWPNKLITCMYYTGMEAIVGTVTILIIIILLSL